MDDLDTREWLLTNGLGSFASGTVCDAHTRTYHGWLFAALDPPSQRTLLLSHIEASLEIGGQVFPLGTHFWLNDTIAPQGFKLLQSFAIRPVPTWVWAHFPWQLTRRLILPYGYVSDVPASFASDDTSPHFRHQTLIQYSYEGSEAATLRLRPLIGDRDFHHQQRVEPELHFSQVVGPQQLLLQAIRPGIAGTPWHLSWTQGNYDPDGLWYWNYHYPEETQRGLADYEDLYSPGYLTVVLQPGEPLTLAASVGWPGTEQPLINHAVFEAAIQAEQQRLARDFAAVLPLPSLPSTQVLNPTPAENSPEPQLANEPSYLWQQLLRAGDQFLVYRASIEGPTVIAGYPWFNDWGRDTLIALPGLALATQRFDLAKGLLQTFGHYCHLGLIPNAFPDVGVQPSYNSIDAALWWIEILGLYLEATADWEFLAQQYPVVQKIYKAFTAGTLYNIRVDAADGLVTWDAPGVALTWMDVVVEGKPITPRRGKPIEINALWYSALRWASQWAERLDAEAVANPATLLNQARRYRQHADQVQASLQQFWNHEQQYFYDTIEPDDRLDARIRPNAVLALSLYHCGFPADQARQVLQVARDRLLTPYGLRSLDPSDPDYIGFYIGPPGAMAPQPIRDRAYHQGTVWSWLIGPFVRAWERFFDVQGSEPLPFDWQPLLDHLQHQACLGSISEIFDGDAPHNPQGAIAQAWSVAEVLRHWPGRE
ncbi:MAG TPA: amylo-alpha-1,6-glucosidase [Candidatus Obscuribacterales bacterium]